MSNLLIVMVPLIPPHLPCYLVLSKSQHLGPWLALGCQASRSGVFLNFFPSYVDIFWFYFMCELPTGTEVEVSWLSPWQGQMVSRVSSTTSISVSQGPGTQPAQGNVTSGSRVRQKTLISHITGHCSNIQEWQKPLNPISQPVRDAESFKP